MTRLSFALADTEGELELLRNEEEGTVVSEGDASASTVDDHDTSFHVLEEAAQLLHIALPSVLIQISLLVIFPMSASAIGTNLSSVELAGFSLGALVGNLTCLSVMIGALTAADTLMPRAYGSNRYEEIGLLAVRGAVVCFLLLIPPLIPLLFYVEEIFDLLGQDAEASHLAGTWIRVYLLGAPANLLFRVIQRFLVAQHQPWPPVYASVVPAVVLHPILLRLLIPKMGFIGSAVAIVISQWTMLLLLLVHQHYRPAYHPDSWPGLKGLSVSYLVEALRTGPLLRFMRLSLGGVFSLSEWWFWEAMCFVAGSFGVIALCAHTIAYNLIPMLFMVPLGMSIGLTVRMGTVIASNPKRAQLMALWTMVFTASVGAVIALCLYALQLPIIRLFTADDEVIRDCQLIWGRVSYYVFVLYVFGINGAILRALGLQWTMASVVLVTLWGLTLPSVLWFAVYQGGGLDVQWSILPVAYTLMQVALVISYTTIDWTTRGKTIRHALRRSIAEAAARAEPTETSRLLSRTVS